MRMAVTVMVGLDAVAREITGELGEGPFPSGRCRVEIRDSPPITISALARHVEVHRLALDEIDRLAADRADHVVFADALCTARRRRSRAPGSHPIATAIASRPAALLPGVT